MTRTALQFYPDDPPLFLARTPHGYHDEDKITADLRTAGFGSVEIHTVVEESGATDPRHPALAYCQGTPLRHELEAHNPSLLDKITDRAAQHIEEKFGPGPVAGKIKGYVVMATK